MNNFLFEFVFFIAYAKGFPLDESLNDIMAFLENHGTVDSCQRRCNKDHKFGGSCFIIFKDKETCQKFVEAESVKYKDVELIRKWQNDYFTQKKKEYDERIKSKKDKQKAKLEQKVKKLEYPKGASIYFSGIAEGKNITREEIKEKIKEVDDSVTVAFVEFSRGDTQGHLRMSTENGAVEFFKKLTDGELEIGDVKLKLKVLEGDEEEEYLKKTAETVAKMREKSKMGGRKRKGGYFSNGGAKFNKKE